MVSAQKVVDYAWAHNVPYGCGNILVGHPSGTPLWHIGLNVQQRRGLTNLRVQEVQ